MSIDDAPNDAELTQSITDDAEKGIEKIIVRAQAVGLFTWFIAGGTAGILAGIGEGFNQLFNRRTYQRLHELRDAMVARLNEVDSKKINKSWFISEEFQTMLFEAARQVTATADRKKILMLGNALANSGIADFDDETRKELFLQMIRDLTPQHIAMLRRLLPVNDPGYAPQYLWNTRRSILAKLPDEVAVLQMLAANGLVTESLKPPQVRPPRYGNTLSPSEARHIIAEFIKDLQKSPQREFRLSEFGRDFLRFVSSANIPEG